MGAVSMLAHAQSLLWLHFQDPGSAFKAVILPLAHVRLIPLVVRPCLFVRREALRVRAVPQALQSAGQAEHAQPLPHRREAAQV